MAKVPSQIKTPTPKTTPSYQGWPQSFEPSDKFELMNTPFGTGATMDIENADDTNKRT